MILLNYHFSDTSFDWFDWRPDAVRIFEQMEMLTDRFPLFVRKIGKHLLIRKLVEDVPYSSSQSYTTGRLMSNVERLLMYNSKLRANNSTFRKSV